MHYRLLALSLLLAASSLGARTASAQIFYGPPGWQQQAAMLNFLAGQALRNNHVHASHDWYHPSRAGYDSGYGSPGSDYADRRLQAELAETRAFYEKRRLRQQYLDEQRERRHLTMQDIEAGRAHHEASLAMMEVNRERALARCQPRSPGRPDVADVNPLSEEIHWPATFYDACFAVERNRLDTVFARRGDSAAAYGRDRSSEVPRLTRAMREELQSMIRELPPS